MNDAPPPSARKFFEGLPMAADAVIASLCETCTGTLEIEFLLRAIRYGDVMPMVIPVI